MPAKSLVTASNTSLPLSAPAPPAQLAADPVTLNAVLIAVRQVAHAVCDRASLLVLLHAHTGACRYGEFAERSGLASRLVTSRLAHLTDIGLFVRVPYSRRPLRHAYHLSHMGVQLFDVLALMGTWEEAWRDARHTGPRVRAEHLGCRHGASQSATGAVTLHCATCGALVNPRDVDLRVSRKEVMEMPAKLTLTRRTSHERGGSETADPAAGPLAQALAVLGDKWSIEVLVCALFGIHKFGSFAPQIGISTNILSDRLGRLVDTGLLERSEEGGGQRKGLYLLTRKGRDFYGILVALQRWADTWIEQRVRSPVRLVHSPCQAPLQPVVKCAACGESLTYAQGKLHIETSISTT